jgi:hypothetical protein
MYNQTSQNTHSNNETFPFNIILQPYKHQSGVWTVPSSAAREAARTYKQLFRLSSRSRMSIMYVCMHIHAGRFPGHGLAWWAALWQRKSRLCGFPEGRDSAYHYPPSQPGQASENQLVCMHVCMYVCMMSIGPENHSIGPPENHRSSQSTGLRCEDQGKKLGKQAPFAGNKSPPQGCICHAIRTANMAPQMTADYTLPSVMQYAMEDLKHF